eukprot:GFUD01002419.1.p1 GENE.GFUD01002419.1~~GFUD01002419.1.p1  ORF type:complete len:322 (+),score=96.78 GFUD01002419.1:91-1056(+)
MPQSFATLEESSSFAASGRKRKKSLENTKVKKPKVDDLTPGAIVKKVSRSDLEQLVLQKMVEVITARSECGELSKKVEKLNLDNTKLKEKAVALQKQLADLTEVTKRIKVLEETKTVRIPKITRSVGLQVASKTKAEIEKDEKKPAVIDIGHEESIKASNVEEIIKKDPLDLLKQLKTKKVEVAKKSTGGKSSKKNISADSTNTTKLAETESKPADENEPLTLNVKKSTGTDGIVITWAKKLDSFDLTSIVNYELEGSKGTKGEKNMTNLKWSRIGNSIRPLPLPMACNLNNFKTGVLYYFRVKLLTRDNSFYSNVSSIIL